MHSFYQLPAGMSAVRARTARPLLGRATALSAPQSEASSVSTLRHAGKRARTMRLVRFLYMIRWPHSRQRIGSRARISFVAEQSACELRRVRWRRRTCADVLHCRRAHADAGRRTSRPRRVAHRRQTVVSRWWRDQRRLRKKRTLGGTRLHRRGALRRGRGAFCKAPWMG